VYFGVARLLVKHVRWSTAYLTMKIRKECLYVQTWPRTTAPLIEAASIGSTAWHKRRTRHEPWPPSSRDDEHLSLRLNTMLDAAFTTYTGLKTI
jgi:hypothetical protein